MKPPAPQPAAVPVALPPVTRLTLPNGLEVVLVEDHALPVTSLDLAVRVGTVDEPREKRSLARFAAAMLGRGTARRSADQVAAAIEQVGGRLEAEASATTTRLTCQVLARDLPTCITVLAEVAIWPRFPEAEMGGVRADLEAGLHRVRDDPAALAAEHLDNALWGDDHPRGSPITAQTIAAIRPRDLTDWHRAWFRPANAVLVVSGDLDARRVRAQVSAAFARWPRGVGALPEHKSSGEPRLAGVKVRLVDKPDQTRATILVGHLGISVADPTWLADELVAFALERALGVRTEAAEVRFEVQRTRGDFRARATARTAEAAATLRLVLGEIARLRDGGPSADEIAVAQASLVGAAPVELQDAPAVGRAILRAELLGLGEAFVRDRPVKLAQVTVEEARAAARQHLDPADLVAVIVGRASEIGPQLQRGGYQVETFDWLDPTSRRDRDARVTQKNAPVDPVRAAQGRKLLDAALQAKGGEARLRAVRDLVATGTVKVVDRGQILEGPFTRWLVPGEALRLDIRTARGTLTVAVTGAGAWVQLGATVQTQPQDLAARSFASLWRDRDLILLRHLEPGTIVEATGREKVDGREYDVVVVKKMGGGLATRILLDPRTRLIFRLEYEERGAHQREEYRDYRAIAGIQFATRLHAEGQGQTIDAVTSDVRLNGGVPPGTFDKPRK